MVRSWEVKDSNEAAAERLCFEVGQKWRVDDRDSTMIVDAIIIHIS